MACIAAGHLAVQGVEGITGIDYGNGLGVLAREDGLHCMNSSLNAGNLTYIELLWPSGFLEIPFGGEQDGLRNEPPWSFTNPNGSDTRTLVDGNQPTGN